MENLQILGERLKYYRKLNKMTQKDLAANLGVAPRYIGHIEQGHRGPSLNILVEMCKWFNIDMSDILPIRNKDTEKDRLIGEINDILNTWETQQVKMLKMMIKFGGNNDGNNMHNLKSTS